MPLVLVVVGVDEVLKRKIASLLLGRIGHHWVQQSALHSLNEFIRVTHRFGSVTSQQQTLGEAAEERDKIWGHKQLEAKQKIEQLLLQVWHPETFSRLLEYDVQTHLDRGQHVVLVDVTKPEQIALLRHRFHATICVACSNKEEIKSPALSFVHNVFDDQKDLFLVLSEAESQCATKVSTILYHHIDIIPRVHRNTLDGNLALPPGSLDSPSTPSLLSRKPSFTRIISTTHAPRKKKQRGKHPKQPPAAATISTSRTPQPGGQDVGMSSVCSSTTSATTATTSRRKRKRGVSESTADDNK